MLGADDDYCRYALKKRECMMLQEAGDEEDLKDASSEVNRFIFEVKTANDEVMRKKFRLEWIVTNIPNNPVLGRKLRLWLKPEEVNEGLHQYLRFDRVHLWGVKEPEAVKEQYRQYLQEVLATYQN